MPTGTDVRWRAYLTGDPTDLARLRRELSTGAVTVAEDDSGIYLQADEFEVCADADEVRVAADPLVVLLNGMASLSFGGYRRVGLSGTIAREESNYLFMEDSFRLSDELSVVRVVAAAGCDQHRRRERGGERPNCHVREHAVIKARRRT